MHILRSMIVISGSSLHPGFIIERFDYFCSNAISIHAYSGVILPNNLEQSFHNILITIRETHEVGGSHSWFTVRQTAIFRGFSPRRGK